MYVFFSVLFEMVLKIGGDVVVMLEGEGGDFWVKVERGKGKRGYVDWGGVDCG